MAILFVFLASPDSGYADPLPGPASADINLQEALAVDEATRQPAQPPVPKSAPRTPGIVKDQTKIGIGIALGAVLGIPAAFHVLSKAELCRGEGCFYLEYPLVLLGGAAGGYAGYKLATREGEIGIGVYMGLVNPTLVTKKDEDGTHLRFSTGDNIGINYDWEVADSHFVGPFFERSSFDIGSSYDRYSVSATEWGIRYNKKIVIGTATLRPGAGVSRGRGKAVELGIIDTGDFTEAYTSYRAFMGVDKVSFFGEVGIQWFENNRLGFLDVSPYPYFKLGTTF